MTAQAISNVKVRMNIPQNCLWHIISTYRTPSGRIVCVTNHIRAKTEAEAFISAAVRICAHPMRRVKRGVDGITHRVYGRDI